MLHTRGSGGGPAIGLIVDAISKYASHLLLGLLTDVSRSKPMVKLPTQLDAAFLFIEFQGLNALLALAGSQILTADKLVETLNGVFERIINIVSQCHGDIVRFTSDTILILWRHDEQSDMTSRSKRTVDRRS